MGAKVFWTKPTGMVDVTLRRYTSGDIEGTCPVNGSYHARRSGVVEQRAAVTRVDDDGAVMLESIPSGLFIGHQWWPMSCECGYAFTDDDEWQVDQEPLYGDDSGRVWQRRGLPVGAMYYAEWLNGARFWTGPDGKALVVIVPEHHEFQPDSQASNCTRRCPWTDGPRRAKHPEHETQPMWFRGAWTTEPTGAPYEAEIAPHSDRCDPGFVNHKCWVRVGDPRTGDVHVSKDGETCAAGAGSIVTPEWHGFLTHGELVP